MEKKLTILILLIFGFISMQSVSAQTTITGKVTDNNTKEPLVGAIVNVVGTSISVSTNGEGLYSINAPSSNVRLQIRYIGYQTIEEDTKGMQVINIALVSDEESLEEVVVIGYGTQSKRNITGAVVDVKGDVIERSPSIGLSNSLTGRLPGVTALNRSGEPGNDVANLLIRGQGTLGSTSPLIVIDGVAEREGMNQLNPRDIESVSVLKDASAAIYGARAANGVILITTKRGVAGKPTINYTFNQGVNQPTRIPEYADAATLAEFTNDQLLSQGQVAKFTSEEIAKFRDGSDPLNYPNTNWRKEALKDFSTQSQHNLSVGAGTNAFKYYLSGSFSNQNGIFKNGITNSKNIGVRVNTDSYITENIKVSLDLSNMEQNNMYPNGSANSVVTSSILESMYRNFPYLVAVYPNGMYGTGFIDNANPLAMAAGEAGYRNGKKNITQTKATIDIKIPQVSGLGFDGFVAYDKIQDYAKTFQKTYFTYVYQPNTDSYKENLAGGIAHPQLTERHDYASSVILNARLKYDAQFSNHKINSFVAVEQASEKSNYFSAFRKNYLTAEVDQLFAGGGSEQVTDGRATEFARRNYFGRLGYNYSGKYLVDFSLRYDGSSAFPKESRWGLFPSVSLGWIVSDENFFQNSLDFISNLKIRGSWGKMGNDAILPFQYLASYSFTDGYIFGEPNLLSGGLIQGVEANPNITWEVANTTNIGLDAQVLEGLFSISFDAFKSRRSNILTIRNASIPDYTGLRLPLENIGIVDNKGFEIALSHQKRVGDFNYSIGGNMSYAENKIIDIDEPQNVTPWQLQTGHQMKTELYYITKGIYRTQDQINNSPHVSGTIIGDLQYEDVNNDGVIDSKDMMRLDKTNTPQIFFGINGAAEYKNFDFSFLIQGQSKAWQYYFIPQGLFGNVLTEMLDNRYTESNPNSKYPNLNYDESQVSALKSDFWLRDASYIRLKNVEIGYTLSDDVLQKVGLKGVRFYLNGFNLITIDKLKWFDPEGTVSRGAHYPQSKIYNFGINLTL
jgi:TonB-linked SusC/RagA family outer membrane protein